MLLRFIFLFIILCPLGYADVGKTLRAIPERDREKIEFLFKFLIQRDTLGFFFSGKINVLHLRAYLLLIKSTFFLTKWIMVLDFRENLKSPGMYGKGMSHGLNILIS